MCTHGNNVLIIVSISNTTLVPCFQYLEVNFDHLIYSVSTSAPSVVV